MVIIDVEGSIRTGRSPATSFPEIPNRAPSDHYISTLLHWGVMFVFAHLMAGILLGLVLAAIAGDRRAVAVCAVGAILPDLIDKPLGHILLKETVDYGRIFFHGLLVLLMLVALGLLLFHYRHTIILLAVAVGVASHQALDSMWRNPVAWLWPFLGPYPKREYEDFFWNAFWAELAQPSEWILFILIIGLFSVYYRRELGWLTRKCILSPLRRIRQAVVHLFYRPLSSRE
jgi:membrane-bound metal-dependent hydrolase YbcI (DUF457 family)